MSPPENNYSIRSSTVTRGKCKDLLTGFYGEVSPTACDKGLFDTSSQNGCGQIEAVTIRVSVGPCNVSSMECDILLDAFCRKLCQCGTPHLRRWVYSLKVFELLAKFSPMTLLFGPK